MPRQMKDSGVEWIGEIPATWEILPAKRMFRNSCETKAAVDVQLTASQQYGIISQSAYMSLTGSRLVLASQDLDKWKHVEPNDFIISLRSFQGGLEMSEVSGCITWHYVVLRSCHDGINARYYKWLFKSSEYITALQRTCNYIRDGQDLRYSNFEQVPLFLPCAEEQERIANVLDKKCAEIDKVVEQTRATIEEYKKLKQAIITEAVTKGVRGARPMKPSGVEWIGDIPEEWSRQKIGNIATFFNGDRTKRYPQPSEFVENGVPFINSTNLDNDELNVTQCKYITLNKYNSLSGAKIKIKDIIICLRGSIGKCCINNIISEGTVASSLAVIRPIGVHPEYLLYCLLSDVAIKQTDINMNGTCAANLAAESVANYFIPVPLISEQQEIATYLDAKCAEIDRIIEKKEQLIAELGSYKKSLIYEYVTGKKEVEGRNMEQKVPCSN